VSAAGDWVSVFAPATIANVGPGFDCFGISLGEPGDIVRARVVAEPGVKITAIRGDGGALPYEAERNTAGQAALAILAGEGEWAARHGLELEIEKGLPAGSGLGSSAASAVCGAVAAMLAVGHATGSVYNRDRVLFAAVDGEAVASGAWHADNVAPALFGGFTIVQSLDPLNVVRLEPLLPCRVAVVTPDFVVETKRAREALPKSVSMRDAVANCANAASLVAALLTANGPLLRAALADRLAEPHRAKLIPGFAEAKRAAIAAGAYGCSIGGSGPTLFALAPDEDDAERAGEAIVATFARHGLTSRLLVCEISPLGARRI
jgi:homoserine kinase